MDVEQWPIVDRSALVRAFKPGDVASNEGPFRTLRSHAWATAGVRVMTRSEGRGHATGRTTIFSALNVDAARYALHGDSQKAKKLARAAALIEASAEFVRLAAELAGNPARAVESVVEGESADPVRMEVRSLLHRLAQATRKLRRRSGLERDLWEVLAGAVSEAQAEYVVVTSSSGSRAAVPRDLARAAHREQIGDCLALISYDLGEQSRVIQAVPGIDLSRDSEKKSFSPFRRDSPVSWISKADAEYLSGSPAPLKILVPVTIES